MEPRLIRADYTVGWVCALPIELAAAQELLDEEHKDLPQDSDDANIYTLGRVGEHNVVIACLPAGQTGTNSAAAVAMQMKSSFRSIRFGLMVGIGGGVPGAEADVRLGDVVVSQPEKGHGGVIQYDFGKTTPGKIERTGFLNTPPRILLSAVTKVRANHDRGQSTLHAHISDMSRLPKFAREKAGVDVLFEGDSDHVEGQGCKSCDVTKVAKREQRENEDFTVHYGTIASGNQVMRDGKTRDVISAEFGGVLCFEMEAAGLMNSFPCLVVRGICDYADSHKNKRWQPYAAAAAAAYAKEVLLVMPATEVAKTQTAEQATHSPTPAIYLPYLKNRRFTGRANELETLERKLFIQQDCTRVAIVGLGGIGKTQAALSFAHSVLENHPEFSVFWVPALSVESFEQAYTAIAKVLGIRQVSGEDQDVKEVVRRHLSATSARKWLLIVDNADDQDLLDGSGKITGLLEYLPESELGLTVFTTRSHNVAQWLVGSDVVEVEKLEHAAAMSLLERSIFKKELLYDKAKSTELLDELDCLPLAITQAAAYMNVNKVSTSKYLQLLRSTEHDAVYLLNEETMDGTRYKQAASAVARTWIVSFQQVARQNPDAGDLLRYISCVEWKGLPESLLPHVEPEARMTSALGVLCSYSFVTKRQDEKTYDMHRLVHLAIRAWQRREGGRAETVQKAMLRLAEVFPSDDYSNREVWRDYLPHVARIRRDTVDEDIEGKGELYMWVGRCLYVDGKIKEAVSWLEESLKWRNMLAEDHPDRLASQHTLAGAYQANGQVKEAVELLKQVVAIERALAEDHPDRLASQHELAIVYKANGQVKEAVELLEQVVAIQRALAEDHPSRLKSQHALALVYKANGQVKEAVELLEQVVAIERALAEDHPDRLASQYALALVYQADGQVKEAVELLEQVVAIERALAEDHPSRLKSQHALALVYKANGQVKEAVELLEQVVAIQRALAEDHPDRLASQHSLAITYWTDGQVDKAVELLEYVVAKQETTLSTTHPDRLISEQALSSLHKEMEM